MARVPHVDKRSLESKLREDLVEDAKGSAVDIVADEHVVAVLEREQDGRGGRAAAAEGDGMAGPLEGGKALLERSTRGVARSRVVVALVYARAVLGKGC